MKFKLLLLLLCLCFGCQTSNLVGVESRRLGVLENQNGQSQVRPLFAYKNQKWVVSTENVYKKWKVLSNGNVVGEFRENSESPEFNIQEGRERFENWQGIPASRPLLTTNFGLKDLPQILERSLPPSVNKKIVVEFRKKVPSFTSCPSLETSNGVQKLYSDKDLLIESLSIEGGSYLVGVKLNGILNQCDGPPESGWSQHWFYMSKNGNIKFVGIRMYPVGAIQSEEILKPWVFATSGYNEDGYILFYDNFRESVSVTWSYH